MMPCSTASVSAPGRVMRIFFFVFGSTSGETIFQTTANQEGALAMIMREQRSG